MTVGSTYATVTTDELFEKVSETEVLSCVFPDIRTLPCLIRSPLREDKKPSFSLYVTGDNHVRYHDFATGDGGNIVDLLSRLWNISYRECVGKLYNENFHGGGISVRTTSEGRIKVRKPGSTKIDVRIREWEDYDADYWKSYGCDMELVRRAEVYPLSHIIITKNGERFTKAAPKYCYVFIERKEGKVTKKVYSPFAKTFKWLTDNDKSVIGLWDKVPETGERLCVCSSLKDAICLWSNTGTPCVYIQGEAFGMSDTAVKELKRRFKTVYVSLDTDKAGMEDGRKLCEKTGFINVIPDLDGCKDYSDAYKKHGREWFQNTMKPLFF